MRCQHHSMEDELACYGIMSAPSSYPFIPSCGWKHTQKHNFSLCGRLAQFNEVSVPRHIPQLFIWTYRQKWNQVKSLRNSCGQLYKQVDQLDTWASVTMGRDMGAQRQVGMDKSNENLIVFIFLKFLSSTCILFMEENTYYSRAGA